MNDQRPARPSFDWELYRKNREQAPAEELARYGDEWVAWGLDGTHVVAHDADLQRVSEEVLRAGLHSEEVVLEHLPPGGEVEALL